MKNGNTMTRETKNEMTKTSNNINTNKATSNQTKKERNRITPKNSLRGCLVKGSKEPSLRKQNVAKTRIPQEFLE